MMKIKGSEYGIDKIEEVKEKERVKSRFQAGVEGLLSAVRRRRALSLLAW